MRASGGAEPPPPRAQDAGKHAPRSVMHMTASRFRRGVKAFAPATTQAQVDMLVEARPRPTERLVMGTL